MPPFVRTHRATLAAAVSFEGVGVHSGASARAVVRPAAPGEGISFRRVDLAGEPSVAAIWRSVGPLVLCTTLREKGAEVSTVEHLMAALAGIGVDDAWVEIDGREVPILDGSAAPFAMAMGAVGLRVSRMPLRSIRVLRPVEVSEGQASARLEPHARFALDYELDYSHPAIGRQRFTYEVSAASFLRELAPARTFGLEAEVGHLRAIGLARGGSLENVVVVGASGVLNAGGLRFPDEFARHKALDAIGDLALAGAPILGRFVGRRSGHALNAALVKALMHDRSAWCWETAATPTRDRVGLLRAA